jgi:hypothetical protein
MQGQPTPEARINKDGWEGRLEVKTATKPPNLDTWRKHIDKANEQIKASGLQGEIVLDWTGVDVHAAGDFQSLDDIERFLNGKMTNTRMRSVRRLEILWNTKDGRTMRTSRIRSSNGQVGAITTEPLCVNRRGDTLERSAPGIPAFVCQMKA